MNLLNYHQKKEVKQEVDFTRVLQKLWRISGDSMRYAKHFDKDLYSRWHRKYERIAMVDVDSVECCYNKGCWQPLALIETVYDTGNYVKYTNVTRWIAKSCHIPAYLVFYKKSTQDSLEFKVRRVDIPNAPLIAMSEGEWVSVLRSLQDQHQKVCKYAKN